MNLASFYHIYVILREVVGRRLPWGAMKRTTGATPSADNADEPLVGDVDGDDHESPLAGKSFLDANRKNRERAKTQAAQEAQRKAGRTPGKVATAPRSIAGPRALQGWPSETRCRRVRPRNRTRNPATGRTP